MLVQINTDKNIDGDEKLTQRIEEQVKNTMGRFADQITRIELHLSDESSDKKLGGEDKRCLMEARVAGLQPVSASHQAMTIDQAVDGAAKKLRRSLDSTLGRLDRH